MSMHVDQLTAIAKSLPKEATQRHATDRAGTSMKTSASQEKRAAQRVGEAALRGPAPAPAPQPHLPIGEKPARQARNAAERQAAPGRDQQSQRILFHVQNVAIELHVPGDEEAPAAVAAKIHHQ